MSDPLRDPRFPNRPQSPDFWRLSEVLLQLDGRSTEGDQSLPELAEGKVDVKTLYYVAINRATILANQRGLPTDMIPVLAAAWADAFLTGVTFEQRGGHQEDP